MRLKAFAASMAAAALVAGAQIASAGDPPNFDFNGYAIVPTTVGGTLTMRSVLTNNGVVPTPIPLDFVNNQYTLVVSGTYASASGIHKYFSPATIEIWEDPIAGGTAADYGNPGTFTDGTMILSGNFTGNLDRSGFTTSLGSFLGTITFTGGTRLAEMSPPNGWPFGGGWSRSVSGIPTGYDENWDGKIDLTAVAVDNQTWDGVKGLYR